MTVLQTLPGFREFYPADCALRNFIFEHFRQSAAAFGFEEYDAPILEPMELFTAKSGEEIAGQLFNFEDRGGRHVALRPEMTPSLARMVGTRANAMRRPIKWFNISEAFRYERPQKGRLRSFYQLNADLLGDSSWEADGEVIALAIQSLRNFGLERDDFHLRLSDRKLWTLFLKSCGIGEDTILPILEIIDKIERESSEEIIKKFKKVIGANAEKLLSSILALRDIHSLDQLEKFLKKFQAIDPATEERMEEISKLVGRIDTFGLSDFMTIDFGIVRGLAYYTGFVFEIFERAGQSRALAGGGRYDDLIKKLGYVDLPAVGFAIGDVTLGNLLKEKGLAAELGKKIDCFFVYSEETKSIAMRWAMNLRAEKMRVEFCLRPMNFAKQLKSAVQTKARFAVIFGEEEVRDSHVKLKNMETGEEKLSKIDRIREGILL
jgi:histidyl-tRNA synthetase